LRRISAHFVKSLDKTEDSKYTIAPGLFSNVASNGGEATGVAPRAALAAFGAPVFDGNFTKS
jgi:hypothetical protein